MFIYICGLVGVKQVLIYRKGTQIYLGENVLNDLVFNLMENINKNTVFSMN